MAVLIVSGVIWHEVGLVASFVLKTSSLFKRKVSKSFFLFLMLGAINPAAKF